MIKEIKHKEIKYILSLCFFFGLYFIAKRLFFSDIYAYINGLTDVSPLSFFISYGIVGVPVLAFVYFQNNRRLLEPIGLKNRLIQGIGFAFVFSIPMLLGYGILSDFEMSLTGQRFWFYCVFPAFFEELYYRGVFFGQLFRNTKLGFIPALLASALVFASLHLYQSDDLSTQIGIFLTTFMGAGLFAWLYVEWDYNLWISIGLHFFMNLSWDLFSVSENALGDINANWFRGLTILLAIAGTIIYKRRKNIPLTINRQSLILKEKE